MELSKGVRACGLALHLPAHKTLVLADLHIGIEDAMRREGVLVPRQHYKEVVRRVTAVLARCPGIERVVLNGDLKHEFGRISDQEWREVKRLIDVLRGGGREVVIVKGNHDVMLGPIAKDKSVTVVGELKLGDILIVHGDVKPKSLTGIKTIIIGHEHPTITLHDKAKAERFKCFLVTNYRFKTLIVQPSFGPLTLGVDVLRGSFLGPFLGNNVMRGRVFV
ncbi:MAG: metallophosphoesterase, partial [Nanoarchaeota archaeon]